MTDQHRELIRISVGDLAALYHTHLSQLEGLGPNGVTHHIHNQLWVPRSLFVVSSTKQDTSKSDQLLEIQRQSNQLARSEFSRYRAPQQEAVEPEEEPDEDLEEVLQEHHARRQRDWKESLPKQQDILDQFWNVERAPNVDAAGTGDTSNDPVNASASETNNSRTQQSRHEQWQTYYNLSPGHPDALMTVDDTSPENRQYERIHEGIRKLLEPTDSCQGLQLLLESSSSDTILDYWKDECPRKSVFCISIHDSNGDRPKPKPTLQTIQANVSKLFDLQRHMEGSDLYLPIHHTNSAPIQVAAALESLSTGYRHLAKVEWNAHAQLSHVSFRDFVKLHQRHDSSMNVIELDACIRGSSFLEALQVGTSVERDHRMRAPPTRGSDDRVLPGAWMLEANQDQSNKGILSNLSYSQKSDRSLHHHFCYSASARPQSNSKLSPSQILTCLGESMGIRYRPLQSLAQCAFSGLYDLTRYGYGVGAYYKSRLHLEPPTNAVAVLGNTTRSYPFLYSTVQPVHEMLARRNKKSVIRSLYNRLADGQTLPEVDDVETALHSMLDVRDLYEPPPGSGLVTEQEGEDIF